MINAIITSIDGSPILNSEISLMNITDGRVYIYIDSNQICDSLNLMRKNSYCRILISNNGNTVFEDNCLFESYNYSISASQNGELVCTDNSAIFIKIV